MVKYNKEIISKGTQNAHINNDFAYKHLDYRP